MDLISPKKIIREKGGPFQAALQAEVKENYNFSENGIEISKSIMTLYNSVPVTPFQAKIPEIIPLNDDLIEKYHYFQNLINYCNNSAEQLNTQLRDLLLSIRTLKETKEDLLGMDFMNLREVFSNFLHNTKIIKEQEPYNSKDKRKLITSTLHQFITDRNIYTHGILKLRRPDEVFLIEYLEKRTEKVYAEITTEMLKSFLETSKSLSHIFSDISALRQKNDNL